MDLKSRKLAVLSLVAKGYLKTGEPIGSKVLSQELGGAVSSATIRNDMAQLEQMGLVFQPHTSAGRIPTSQGLHLYIDKLMEKRRIPRQQKNLIDSIISGSFGVDATISAVSQALADYSHCASFFSSPSSKNLTLKQIEFIKTGTRTMVFVLITETDAVESVFVRLDSEISDSALAKLSEVVKSEIIGMQLCDITPSIFKSMATKLIDHYLLFAPFFEALENEIAKMVSPIISVKGQDNLMRSAPSQNSAANALSLLKSETLLNLIIPSDSARVSIVIPENESEFNTALLYSGYAYKGNTLGTIGILGPSRLDYSSLIPMLEYFSVSLENMIRQNDND